MSPPAFARSAFVATPDFSQTQHLDRWHEQGDVTFCFGLDVTWSAAHGGRRSPQTAWKPLNRSAKYQVKTKPRSARCCVGSRSKCRGFEDIRLVDEWIAERPYRPVACKHTYRLVILRKNLQVSEPHSSDYSMIESSSFLYITDDWDSTPEEIVFDANDRCQQENARAAQCRSGLAWLLDNLLSNNAYMLITSLAWNLSVWFALCLPEPCDPKGQAGRAKTRTVDDGVSHIRQFPGARARPSRTNRSPIGDSSIGLERVAVCVPAIGRAAATAAPLLKSACPVSYGRRLDRLFETGIR